MSGLVDRSNVEHAGVSELVAAVGDRGGDVQAIRQLERKDRLGVIDSRRVQLRLHSTYELRQATSLSKMRRVRPSQEAQRIRARPSPTSQRSRHDERWLVGLDIGDRLHGSGVNRVAVGRVERP